MYLEFKNISKRFGEVVALSDFSMSTQRESLTALLGPSGCGKTTLLRILAGFEEADGGDILINGSSIMSHSPKNRRVGIVFQDYALFPHMSVEKNIAYGLKFEGSLSESDKTARARDLLSLLQLESLRERMPDELSAGQQQRVALARSLAPSPEILLLDEPLSALDDQLRVQLRFELKQLLKHIGVTTIHVTHDQEEALAIADRVAVMRGGSIEQFGSPEEIYGNPATPFVAEFVGRGNVLEANFVASVGAIIELELFDGQRIQVANNNDLSFATGDKLKLLIRPEHMSWEGQDLNSVEGVYQGSEYLGDSTLIYVEIAKKNCVVKLSGSFGIPRDLQKNQSITLAFNPKDAKIFL
jgi:ABC-type Fe3+/spermidine/putrescine transport system ATPase subunit